MSDLLSRLVCFSLFSWQSSTFGDALIRLEIDTL